MALAAGEPFAQLSAKETLRSCNDAFSFWKLPEDWRDCISNSIDKSRIQAEHFLFERYVAFIERRSAERSNSRSGWVDRSASRSSSRWEIRGRARLTFPRWPCETALIEYWRRWLSDTLEELRLSDGWHLAFWPEGARCSIVLTHDIHNVNDLAQIDEISDLEERFGFRSAWYLPLEDLEVDWRRICALQSRGFEFGVGGVRGADASSSEPALRRLRPRLEQTIRGHQIRGFRAPSVCRNVAWISGLDFDFDSTFCDTDPFDSKPGGTCSIFPFFIGGMVELPVTLGRDHTLIQFLRRNPLSIWSLKARWIASAGGMILAATEPRFLSVESYLAAYKDLLTELSGLQAWRARPSEVAAWWRHRNQASLLISQTKPVLAGSDVRSLTIQKLSEASIFQ
jgi:hypothetical protein